MLLAKKNFEFHSRVQKCQFGNFSFLPKWNEIFAGVRSELTRLKCTWTRKWMWKFVDIVCTLAFFLFSINAHFQLSMTRTWNSTTFHDFYVYLTSLNTVEKEHLIFLPPWVEYEFWCKTGTGHISPVNLDCYSFTMEWNLFSKKQTIPFVCL